MATEPNPNKRLATMADFVRLLNHEAPVDSKHLGTHWVEQGAAAATHWVEDDVVREEPAPQESTSNNRSTLGLIVGSLAATGVVGGIGLLLLLVSGAVVEARGPRPRPRVSFRIANRRHDGGAWAPTYDRLKVQEGVTTVKPHALRDRRTLTVAVDKGPERVELSVFRELEVLEELVLIGSSSTFERLRYDGLKFMMQQLGPGARMESTL